MAGPVKQNRKQLEAVANRLHSAAIHLLRGVRARDREMGIGPAQASALSVLVFGGPRSLGELARAEQVRPPTMSRIVAGLVRAGMVRRRTAGEDRRRLRLEATEKGVRVMQEGRRRRIATLARALQDLSEQDLTQLAGLAELIERLSRGL